MLDFEPVSLEMYDTVYGYMSLYGEGSCQHSFVSMYSLFEKYGDCICEKDGFLYTFRSRLKPDGYRAYLAPMGGGDKAAAYEAVLNDAHENGAKAAFITLTKAEAAFLEERFSDRFAFENDRDLAEYMYRTEKMAYLPGGALVKRRTEANQFWNTYGSRASVERITSADFAEILDFERYWLAQNMRGESTDALEQEACAIEKQLAYWDELHLSGVVLRLDGKVRGYSYGTPLSDEFYDALIEKGDKELVYPYRVLRKESVRQCALDRKYVNMEEDVGIEGLRKLKQAYKPEYLLEKFRVYEK